MTNTTTPAATYGVVLMNMRDGSVQGHKAGCADLKRGTAKFAEPTVQADEVWEVRSKAEAREEYNADFDQETDGWYDVDWAACAKHVPAETPAAEEAEEAAEKAHMEANVPGVKDLGDRLAAEAPEAKPAKLPAAAAMRKALVETGELTRDQVNAHKGQDLKDAYTNLVLNAAPAEGAPAKAEKAASSKKAAPAKAEVKDVQAARLAALDKAREARAAKALQPAPEVNGIKFQTSGKHGIVEGGTFLFHGDAKAAPEARGRKVTMKIVDRVFITGLDTKGQEVMRAHIAKSFWASAVTAPKAAKKADKAAPAKGEKATAAK